MLQCLTTYSLLSTLPPEVVAIVDSFLHTQTLLDRMAEKRKETLEAITPLITTLNSLLPGDNVAVRTQQDRSCRMLQAVNNANLDWEAVEFTDVNDLSSIAQELVRWGKPLDDLMALDEHVGVQLAGAKFKMDQAHSAVRELIIGISRVIRKAIARLALIRARR